MHRYKIKHQNRQFWIVRCRKSQKNIQMAVTQTLMPIRACHHNRNSMAMQWPISRRWHGEFESISNAFHFGINFCSVFLHVVNSTLQRPFKNLPPTGKAIPPPKISDTYQSKASLQKAAAAAAAANAHNSNPPPPPSEINSTSTFNPTVINASPPLPPMPAPMQINESLQQAALPDPPASNNTNNNNSANDESNYAVTEL